MNDGYDVETGEVVEGQLVRLPKASDNGGPDLLAVLEKRNNLLERVLEYAIKATHPGQWNDLGGKPWPTGPACESMARRCGVSITGVMKMKRESSDDQGDFYIWEVSGRVSLPSGFDVVEAFGTCSSRDQFLGTETAAGRKLSEIDEGNIMKAAYTNFIVNGVTRLLGVRNLGWERLKELGLDRNGMAKVEYEKGAKGGGGSKAKGLDEVMKFGPGKDKALGEMSDEHLAQYRATFEKELPDPEKARFKKKNEERIALITAELARRANEKAGTAAPKATSQAGYWDRLKQLAGARNVTEERLKALTKHVLQADKVTPSELTEQQFSAIADALAKEAPTTTTKPETF